MNQLEIKFLCFTQNFYKCQNNTIFECSTLKYLKMKLTIKKTLKLTCVLFALAFSKDALAQDGTIYPLETPKEPNAKPLGTGGVENQPASETWFKQWGDPMARNITKATLTPFLPEPGKANGAAVIVAPGGGFSW